MLTYDRSIRTLLHSTLRQFCGCAGEAALRAGGDTPPQSRDKADLALIGGARRCGTRPPAQRKRRLAGLAAAVIILGTLIAPSQPAQAQDDANPPISATSSSTLYLPAMARNWHAWFDDAELDEAIRRAGYDVETASMHIVCTLDPSSVVPYLIRYSSCEQYLIGTTPTEGTGHFIWYVRMGDGIVTGLEVGQ